VLFASPDTSSLVLSQCTLTGNVAQGGAGHSGGNGGDALGGGLAAVSSNERLVPLRSTSPSRRCVRC
jgi:hypothetical protein